MENRFQDPVFWQNVMCPTCGYLHHTTYTPDLLTKPTELLTCTNCNGRFSYAIYKNSKAQEKLEKLVKLAHERRAARKALFIIENQFKELSQ